LINNSPDNLNNVATYEERLKELIRTKYTKRPLGVIR
jgi:hypothetical protein